MIFYHAEELLTPAQIEHVDQFLAQAYDIPLEPYSTCFSSAMKLHQLLMLDGWSVMTDTDHRLSTCRIGRNGVFVEATTPTLAESVSQASLVARSGDW